MHIMHVIDSLEVGGAERMLVEIANQTAADGHQVSVCVTRSQHILADSLRPGIALTTLNRGRRFEWDAMKIFATLIKDQKVEVIQAHSRSTFAFLSLAKTLRLIHPPIILHDHYGSIEIDPSIPLWFRIWAKHFLHHYVGVYSKLATWAEAAGLPQEKISVIENALDLKPVCQAVPLDLRRELGLPAQVLIGIVAGGIRPEKGIDVLLEAVARCSCRHLIKILVAGGDRDRAYAQACRAQSTALQLEDRVDFLGERLDFANLIKGADFALIPSRSESGPLVLIEYLAAGLPFVSTRVGAVACRVAGLGIPEFVAPGEAGSLAAALDRLVHLSPAERRARAQSGKTAALGCFDIRQQMPHWYRIYEGARPHFNKP
jgi:glycosyltransferase involved in cell wall biosynthesis